MSDHAVSDAALDTIFREAHTQNKWTDKTVSPALLMTIYDLMRLAPTAANTSPARIAFVTSDEAKARLKPILAEGNREKTMTAPVIALIGHDLDFYEHLPKLFPNNPKMKDNFAGKPELIQTVAFRNGSLQGAYFMVAARALGLDCGPMGGFDRAGVDKEFFAGTNVKSDFLCALGHGNPAALHPRAPRLSFDQACQIL